MPDRIRVWEALHLLATLASQRVDETEALRRWGLDGKRATSYGNLSGAIANAYWPRSHSDRLTGIGTRRSISTAP